MIFDYLKKEVEEQYKRFHERHNAQGGVTHLIPETVLMGLQEMGIEIPEKDDVVAMTKFINYCSDEMVDTKKESQIFAYLEDSYNEAVARNGNITHPTEETVLKDLISRGIVDSENSTAIEEVGIYELGFDNFAHPFEKSITDVIGICYRDLSKSLEKNESEKTM